MPCVRYKMEPEMVALYYEAFGRLERTLHESHRGSFQAAFHLYQDAKPFQKARWINVYLDYIEYDLWDIDPLVNDFDTMVRCLGFELHFVHEHGNSEYIC
jgi:hypothetical protein